MIEHMNALPLKRPTPTLVIEHVEQFDLRDPGLTDQALARLLTVYPNNHDLPSVLAKAAIINSLYGTNIYAISDVARHICQLAIDTRLQQGDPTLVNDIALIRIHDKIRNNYSFASKYCGWHQPNNYPIYDSYVDQLLWIYRQQDQFTNFKRQELWHYPRYKEIIERFRSYYDLYQFGFKELDKFLWRYGKEVFGPQSGQTPSTDIHS